MQLPDPIKIVADESVDFRIIIQLRLNGFEVYAICETQPSITDNEVLNIANSLNALLITEDKDFGELVFRLNFPHKGILLIRIESAIIKIATVVEVIKTNYQALKNNFSVLNEKILRIKE